MKTIGIIGGGQLGLMIAEQARHCSGLRTVCLDPAADAPAGAVRRPYRGGRFDDPEAVEELCRRSDVVTYEFENVPGRFLSRCAKNTIFPRATGLSTISQDRLREKSNAREHGLQTPRLRRGGRRGVAARRRGRHGPPGRAEDPHARIRRPRAAGAAYGGRHRAGPAAACGAPASWRSSFRSISRRAS